jgi:hypothetical protein
MEQPKQPNQIRALEIYLESATYENDYKPLSCVKLSEKLKAEGFDGCGKTAINDWVNKFEFKKHLELKMQVSFTKDKSIAKTTDTLRQSVEKDLVSVERNGILIGKSYTILEKYTDQVLENIETHNRFNREDIKMVKDIAVLTTGREDKMLDRLANASQDKVTSDQLMDAFNDVEIEVETE